MSRPKGWLGMGYEGEGRKEGTTPPALPRILGISESDRQPLHTTPPWLPPHSGGNPLLSQVVEAQSPHPSSSSDLSPLPSRNLGFPDHYCPRTFVPAMPSGDSLAQCKSMSSERLFLLTLFSLPWNYPDGMGHKAQEDKNLIYPGPGGSPAPCTGPT